MKTRIAMVSLAVVLYATVAVAQHGQSGGASGGGMGMSAAMGHGSGLANHGKSGTANTGSSSTRKTSVDEILSKNPAIGNKIQTLTGTPASMACAGFKNLGQSVAAAHVSKNLPGVNFYCLREAMTGNTQVPIGTTCNFSGSLSLGKAVQKLDPHADSKSESKKGETQAQQDLKSSGVQS